MVEKRLQSDIISHHQVKSSFSKSAVALRQDVLTKKILKVCRDLLLRDLQSISKELSILQLDPAEGVSTDSMRLLEKSARELQI